MSWQEILIELVRDRPILYDKSCNNYKDSRVRKLNNWKDITAEVNKQCDAEYDGKLF